MLVEVIVDWVEGFVYLDKILDFDFEFDLLDWEYFYSLMLVRSVILFFLLNVWFLFLIFVRVGLWEILCVIFFVWDLLFFFLDSFWMELLMFNNCFIRLIFCVLIFFWKKKIVWKYFCFNFLKNFCIKM